VASFHLGRLPDVQTRRLTSAAMIPAQPALTAIYALDGERALHGLYYRGGRYHLWATLLIALPFVGFAPAIVDLYVGPEYASAALVMTALLLVYPFLWASAMFYRIAHAVGNVRAYYVCDMAVQAISFGSLVYAVRVAGGGAVGAAVGVAISTGLLHVLLVWPMGLRLVGGRWMSFVRETVVPGTLPFFAGLLVCYSFARAMTLDSWAKIGLGTALAVLAYILVLAKTSMQPADWQLAGRAADRWRRGRTGQRPTTEAATARASTR
jgi:O-antigen/teichoic acid export membrane protein